MTAGTRDRAGWLLCAVPLIGLLELVLHVKQTGPDVVADDDWTRARDLVKADLKPDDLIVFEPYWTDPLGRRSFGNDIATMKREGFSDVGRYARAYEVSIRGFHDPDLATWKKVKEEHAGQITVTLLQNPAPQTVVEDLLDVFGPERVSVARVDGANETPCTYTHGSTAGGSTVVPQGLLTPADKFVCNGGHVGVAVMHGMNHHPRLCLFSTPMSTGWMKLRFKDVAFGTSIIGHAGVQWVDARQNSQERLELSFSLGDRLIAPAFHRVGGGWDYFELPTSDMDGKKGELVVEVAPSRERQFCWEATTRR